MSKQQFLAGHEYDLGDGTTGVWNGKGMVSADDYIAAKGQGQQAFGDSQALMQRIEKAQKMVSAPDAGIPIPGTDRYIPLLGLGARTGQIGKMEAGDGGRNKGIGGTPGYDLDKTLLPIRSNAMIKNMQALKQASPTGSTGMGNMSNAEGDTLRSTDATLDVGQSKPQLQSELNTYQQALIRHTPGLHPSNPIPWAPGSATPIPEGAYFRDPSGRVFQQTKGSGAVPPPQQAAPARPTMAPRTAAPAAGGWSGRLVTQ